MINTKLHRLLPNKRSLAAALAAGGSFLPLFMRFVFGSYIPSFQQLMLNPVSHALLRCVDPPPCQRCGCWSYSSYCSRLRSLCGVLLMLRTCACEHNRLTMSFLGSWNAASSWS